MAFCTNCGAPVPDGARFCTKCGAPITAAPAAPQPKPQQPPYQGQPVKPAASAPQGIVIDAPEGATVTISDVPPQETSVQAPAEKGEFVLVNWDEPKPKNQPRTQAQQPAYQQPPQYRQPQYPQQPYPQQQPYQQAPQYPQQPQYPPQQPVATNPGKGKNKRKWYFWLVVIALVIFIIIQLLKIF